jgi:hypothetical protein
MTPKKFTPRSYIRDVIPTKVYGRKVYTTRNPVIYAAVSLLVVSAVSSERALQAQDKTPRTVSICQLTSHPKKFLGNPATLRIRVSPGRHATYISDRVCPKQSLFLVDSQGAVKTNTVSHFYEFLADHRGSGKPIFATITGRLVIGSERGFVLKRDYDFELESMSEISEGKQSKHP